MVDLGQLFAAVGASAVVLGLIIGIRQLRHFSKVRAAEVLRTIADRLENAEFLRNFFLISRMKYASFDEIEGKPEEIALFQWLTCLEGMGLMVKHGVVPLGVVDDYWHGVIRMVWTKTAPVVTSYRSKYNHPEFGEWAEYLYLRIYAKEATQAERVKEIERRLYARRLH